MFEEWNLTNTRIDTNTQNIQTYDHVYILLVNILNISIKNARFWLKSRIDGFEILTDSSATGFIDCGDSKIYDSESPRGRSKGH